LAAAAIVLCLSAVAAVPARADTAGDLKKAQAKANAAAARYSAAQSALARAENQVADVRVRRAAALARVSQLELQVRSLAVDQYVNGGQPTLSADNLIDAARGQALLRYAVTGSLDALDQYRAAREDLDASSAALEAKLGRQRSAVAGLRKQRATAHA
jgi:peptidoglycan hydrolase CwlO-like protein